MADVLGSVTTGHPPRPDRPTVMVAVDPGPADPALRARLLARERAWRVEAARHYLESLGYTVTPPATPTP